MLTRKSNMADTIPPKTEYSVAGDLLLSVSTFPTTRKNIYSKSNPIYSNSYSVLRVCDVFALA